MTVLKFSKEEYARIIDALDTAKEEKLSGYLEIETICILDGKVSTITLIVNVD